MDGLDRDQLVDLGFGFTNLGGALRYALGVLGKQSLALLESEFEFDGPAFGAGEPVNQREV